MFKTQFQSEISGKVKAKYLESFIVKGKCFVFKNIKYFNQNKNSLFFIRYAYLFSAIFICIEEIV